MDLGVVIIVVMNIVEVYRVGMDVHGAAIAGWDRSCFRFRSCSGLFL